MVELLPSKQLVVGSIPAIRSEFPVRGPRFSQRAPRGFPRKKHPGRTPIPHYSPVAQWQSPRLLIGRFLVRVQVGEHHRCGG